MKRKTNCQATTCHQRNFRVVVDYQGFPLFWSFDDGG